MYFLHANKQFPSPPERRGVRGEVG